MKKMLFVLVFISFASAALCGVTSIEIPATSKELNDEDAPALIEAPIALMELNDEEWEEIEKEMGMMKAEILSDTELMRFLTLREIESNDELAKSTIFSLSVAAETFATGNNGNYPEFIEDLTEDEEPYLSKRYCGEEISGYKYVCEFSKESYKFVAIPIEVGVTGTETFTITTGGVRAPDFHVIGEEELFQESGAVAPN